MLTVTRAPQIIALGSILYRRQIGRLREYRCAVVTAMGWVMEEQVWGGGRTGPLEGEEPTGLAAGRVEAGRKPNMIAERQPSTSNTAKVRYALSSPTTGGTGNPMVCGMAFLFRVNEFTTNALVVELRRERFGWHRAGWVGRGAETEDRNTVQTHTT
ncbi:hypothetical protein B0H19DRAFT_1055509 [Mycena capillaripes]|nr:hypothetical protein B0H19DRAFT_1055509 [Mycena capillaripes]